MFTIANDYPPRACDCILFAFRNRRLGMLKRLVRPEIVCRAGGGAG